MFLENDNRRRTGAWIYIIVGVLLIVGAGVLAFSMTQDREGGEAKSTPAPTAPPAVGPIIQLPEDDPASLVVPSEVLEEGAQVVIRYHHTACNHIYEEKLDPAETRGMSKSDLIIRYSNMELQEFSTSGAVLTCTLSSYCPEHYLVKLNGTKLCIYRTRVGTEEQILVKELNVDTSGMDTTDFQEGVLFDSMEDIESFLENLES